MAASSLMSGRNHGVEPNNEQHSELILSLTKGSLKLFAGVSKLALSGSRSECRAGRNSALAKFSPLN
jgi:hypothetical protein